ncbi:hypothetical protein [Lentzea aerocolonigenes]|nr:hypothetical protein [Lentzea aerocolonigenes]
MQIDEKSSLTLGPDRPQDLEDGFVEGFSDSGVAFGRRGWDAAVHRRV